MADTTRLVAELQALFADPVTGAFSPQDLLESLPPSAIPTGRAATKFVASCTANDLQKAQADYVCDGTADDVEINAAIAALPPGGGKVVLSEGTFDQQAIINAVSRLTLEGQGQATVIKASGAFVADIVAIDTISDVTIRNIRFDGNNAGGVARTYQIRLDTADHVLIEGCYFYDASGVGVGNDSATEDCTDVLITNNFFENTDKEGVRFSDSDRIIVKGCHLTDCAKDGGYLSYVLLNTGCTACLVQGNTFHATAVVASRYGVDVGASSRMTISGNDFYQLEMAIWMEKVACTDITITGNTFNACGKAGVDTAVIEIGPAATQAPSRIVISGNLFYYSQRRDIENSCTSVAATGLVITGNLFSNNSQDAGDWWSVALGRATDCLV